MQHIITRFTRATTVMTNAVMVATQMGAITPIDEMLDKALFVFEDHVLRIELKKRHNALVDRRSYDVTITFDENTVFKAFALRVFTVTTFKRGAWILHLRNLAKPIHKMLEAERRRLSVPSN